MRRAAPVREEAGEAFAITADYVDAETRQRDLDWFGPDEDDQD